MYRIISALLLLFTINSSSAHQLTPTYPKFIPSYVSEVFYAKMELFNKRKDVNYYQAGVFTETWEPIPFISENNNLIYVKYLETKKLNIYVKQKDLYKVVYICTESKLRQQDTKETVISSKICSKVK